MNKIVCDVCGTSYPETAVQCPICGTAKTDTAKSTTGGESGYAYVKGGRFSHANVRKRNAGKKELPRVVAPVKPRKETEPKPRKETTPKAPKETTPPTPRREPPVRKPTSAPTGQKPSNEKRERGINIVLALIALLLVLAIVAVFAYIVKGYIDGRKPTEPVGGTTTQSTAASTSSEISCTGVRLALSEKTFTSLEDKFYLSVTVSPVDTTDTVWYESSDELVATVDEKGIVYPVADGQATIYVHCGEFTAECYITCEVGVEPIDPNQPTGPSGDPTVPVDPNVVLELTDEDGDITMKGYGTTFDLYDGELDPSVITWETSDPSIATVEKGWVTAVGNGICTITATYGDQKVTCIVRCEEVVISQYELLPSNNPANTSHDYTVKVGEGFTIWLVEKETGKRIQPENLTFALSKEGIISINEKGTIKALAKGTVTVTVTYGDQVLECIVRVKNG